MNNETDYHLERARRAYAARCKAMPSLIDRRRSVELRPIDRGEVIIDALRGALAPGKVREGART